MADPLYNADYRRRARAVRQAAWLNPCTPCGRCGKTLAEHPPTATGKRPSWDAGHIRDSDPTSPLQPEVASCNRSSGAAMGNRMRAGLTTTQDW